jgi:hypothetical protein
MNSMQPRQPDHHTRSLPLRAFHLNRSAMLADDVVYCRKTQPITSAWRLSAKKWFEDVGSGFVIHSTTGITDRELHR